MQLSAKITLLALTSIALCLACELDTACNQCINKDCVYVVRKDYNTACIKDGVSIDNIRLIVEKLSWCKKAADIIERNVEKIMARGLEVSTFRGPDSIPLLVETETLSTTSRPLLVSTTPYFYRKNLSSGSTDEVKKKEIVTSSPSVIFSKQDIPVTDSAQTEERSIVPKNGSDFIESVKSTTEITTTSTTSDRSLRLSDAVEIFLRLPTSYNCDSGKRNESLLVSYASSLCMIAKLSNQFGIKNFSDTDMGWLLMNPARRFFGQCTAIRRYRKKCRDHTKHGIRPVSIGLQRGQRSPLFGKVDSLWHCGESKKEELLMRLARTIYAGELFLKLKESTQLHNYDLAYGLSNVSYRHAFKCASLYFKKRRCYK